MKVTWHAHDLGTIASLCDRKRAEILYELAQAMQDNEWDWQQPPCWSLPRWFLQGDGSQTYTPTLTSQLSILADMVILSHAYHVTLLTVFVRGYTQFDTLLPFIYSCCYHSNIYNVPRYTKLTAVTTWKYTNIPYLKWVCAYTQSASKLNTYWVTKLIPSWFLAAN